MYSNYVDRPLFREFFSLNYMNVMRKCEAVFRKPENQRQYNNCVTCISAIIMDINSAMDNNLRGIWAFLSSLPNYEFSSIQEYQDIIFFFNMIARFYDVPIEKRSLHRTIDIQKNKAKDYAADLKTLLDLHPKTAQIWKMVEKNFDKNIVESIIETFFEFGEMRDLVLRTYKLKYFYENFGNKS